MLVIKPGSQGRQVSLQSSHKSRGGINTSLVPISIVYDAILLREHGLQQEEMDLTRKTIHRTGWEDGYGKMRKENKGFQRRR